LIRDPVVNGRFPALETVAIGAASAALAAATATAILWRFERRIIFYL
jgi:hypothetical protein